VWIACPLGEETLIDVSPTAQTPEWFRHPTVATVEESQQGCEQTQRSAALVFTAE
jgi:hypothetical protein